MTMILTSRSLFRFAGASLAFGLLASAGCANYATLADPDTVPKGDTKIGLGLTFTKYQAEVNDETSTVSVPALMVSGRHGLTDKLEVAGRIWIPFGASAGGKYQLVGHRDKAGPMLSVGGELGFMQITAGSGDEESSANILDVYLPVAAGYRINPSLAIYATPKYILRTLFGDSSGTQHILGASVGASFGSKTKVMIEATSMYDLTNEEPIYNAGIGLEF